MHNISYQYKVVSLNYYVAEPSDYSLSHNDSAFWSSIRDKEININFASLLHFRDYNQAFLVRNLKPGNTLNVDIPKITN